MSLVTNLIDDKSPLILYDSTWLPGNSWDDLYADLYYLGTFTTNNVTNGAASFSFNGTGVWIYGAKRSNHNTYTVQLDDVTYGPYTGYYVTQEFMQVLFNYTTLSQGLHNLTLTNTGTNSEYVDIDLIVWQSEVGNSDQELITETVQDTDPRFQYQNSVWASPPDANFYNNGTGHYTEGYLASVSFIFTGTSVSLWTEQIFDVLPWYITNLGEMVTLFGATSTSTGPYTVQLDGGNVSNYNGTAFLPFYGVTLFHADNLGSGQHNLTLTNVPAATGQQLCIDYALVYSPANVTLTTGSTGTGSITPSKQLSSGGIVGIAVSAAAAVFAFLLAFFFHRKMKSAEAAYQQLCNIHTTQRQPEVPIGSTTSLEARSPPGLVRQGTGYLPVWDPSQLAREESRTQLLGRSFPETPGEGERQSRQPLQDGRVLTQNAEIQAMSPSPPATELPPAYAHAVEAGGT